MKTPFTKDGAREEESTSQSGRTTSDYQDPAKVRPDSFFIANSDSEDNLEPSSSATTSGSEEGPGRGVAGNLRLITT